LDHAPVGCQFRGDSRHFLPTLALYSEDRTFLGALTYLTPGYIRSELLSGDSPLLHQPDLLAPWLASRGMEAILGSTRVEVPLLHDHLRLSGMLIGWLLGSRLIGWRQCGRVARCGGSRPGRRRAEPAPAVLGATSHRDQRQELIAVPNVDTPCPVIWLRQVILSLLAFFFDFY